MLLLILSVVDISLMLVPIHSFGNSSRMIAMVSGNSVFLVFWIVRSAISLGRESDSADTSVLMVSAVRVPISTLFWL